MLKNLCVVAKKVFKKENYSPEMNNEYIRK